MEKNYEQQVIGQVLPFSARYFRYHNNIINVNTLLYILLSIYQPTTNIIFENVNNKKSYIQFMYATLTLLRLLATSLAVYLNKVVMYNSKLITREYYYYLLSV